MSTDRQANASKVPPRTAEQILAEEFLLARSKILDLAATLDRLERASGNVDGLPPSKLLEQGLAILRDDQPDKAKRVQLLMSRPYDPDWRNAYGLH
ncbi:MAG: hypothetical protein ACK5OB_19235 [Pirellula sp.]|jgi:hypothetical protein